MRMRLHYLGFGAALLLATPLHAETLYTDLGERAGLEHIVATAMGIWTTDPRIASTFEDSDLGRLQRMIVEQLCQLTGGGCVYSGHSMREAHKGLHLATNHFNALVEDLQRAMDQSKVSFQTQNRLLALLAPMYRDVVTR